MTESPKPPKRSPNLYERIRARVEPVGGVDLELPPREPGRDPPNFDTADYDLPPDWLQKAWFGAKQRGLGAVTADEINAEIDAVRADASSRRNEDDA
jgi:hypothetical protein